MSRILIRTKAGDNTAELDDSDLSNTIWLSLPLSFQINMLGSEIYFEMPVSSTMTGEQVTELDVGDIAYWPKVGAFCIFFGPTPLSGDDGRPVSAFPVIRIGRMTGDCSNLEYAGDRQTITLEKLF